MSLDLVFWDWAGTLVVNNINMFSGAPEVKSDVALLDLKRRVCINKIAWYLVERLLKNGISQVVVSNGTKRSIVRHLKSNPFDMILTSEEYAKKPDTEMLEVAAERLSKFDKTKMIMIGDSEQDCCVAKNFGVEFFNIAERSNCVPEILKKFNLF